MSRRGEENILSPALDIQSMRPVCSPGGTVERPVGLSSINGLRLGRLGVQEGSLGHVVPYRNDPSLTGDGLGRDWRGLSSTSGLKDVTSRIHSF
jgi:hypothetical protein